MTIFRIISREIDLTDTLNVLWRRKGLTFALLLLTLIGVAGAAVKLPWTYKASDTETLLNSESSSQTIGGGNPYLSYDSALLDVANVLALKLTDNQNTLALQQQGDTASFQAQVLTENEENEEPFIQISVSGSSKAAVAQTLQGTVASLSNLLAQLQAGVAPQDRASLQTITDVSTPVRSTGDKLKPLIGVLGVGLVLTFLIPQAVEGAARRRKGRDLVNTSIDDRPRPRNEGYGTESDRFRQSQASDLESEHWQRPDQQIGDGFRGQRRPPARQGGRGEISPEYGVPSSEDGRYPQPERRWLYGPRKFNLV